MGALISGLIRATGLAEGDVWRIVRNAPRRYKVYTIPKRSGGTREIAHPAVELKALQRALLANYLNELPVHPAATAYERGSSIRQNALLHAENNGPILKLDFTDFFPSIRERDWKAYCRRQGIFDDAEDLWVSTRILFRQVPGSSILRLSIGAPTSPKVSNVLLYEFDRRVTEQVARDHVTYTRYADDMTFSARRTGYLTHVIQEVHSIIRELPNPKLKINHSKTIIATKKYHRQVTGLVLSNDGAVSLGRDRKRKIRAQIDHFLKSNLSEEESRKLAGWLAFTKSVEPSFYSRMQRKYGEGAIAKLHRLMSK